MVDVKTVGEGVKDPCEYNPDESRAVYADEVHALATVIVGAKGQWRLCAQCAALPRFDRFRVRTQIKDLKRRSGE